MGKLHCSDPDPAAQHPRPHQPLCLSCLGCFRKPFPLPVTFLGLSFESEAPSYISTCIFIQEPTEEQLPRPCVARALPMGLFGSTSSRTPALDAYLNQLDLEVKLDFGSDQKPSVPLFPSWTIWVLLAVKFGCRQGLPCVCGELVLRTAWFLGAGGTGAVIKYEHSDFTVWPGSWRREISVIRSNCCGWFNE